MSKYQKYSQSITLAHRTAFVIMLDQSASMNEYVFFDNHKMLKAEAVAEIANRTLFELIERARRGSEVRDYYDLAVVGYSGDKVRSLLTLSDEDFSFIPISQLAQRDVEQVVWSGEYELEDGQRAILLNKTPLYVTSQAEGATPMFEAMMVTRDMVGEWCSRRENAESFPPIIINITDGEFSDCTVDEIRDTTHQIRRYSTKYGNVLLLNLHIASYCDRQLIFPTRKEVESSSPLARILAECSSVMPNGFNTMITEYRGSMHNPPYIGMSYNAPITEVLNMINIGSVSINNIG